jgi:Ca2+ transporting ATPase
MRAGKVQRIDLKTVVVGDILYFEIGDILPVDGLMLTGSEVKVDESAMTGETDEIKKLSYSEVVQ